METAEIEVLVDELGERVERLRALYEQYFMGIEKLEPTIARKDCDRRLWVLRREQIRNTGLRFKLNMIIQRYNTYQQYWQRILREIEAGTYKRDLRKVANRFGTEALTIQARKRFGKMIERTTDADTVGSKGRSSYEDEEIDVEIDDFDSDQDSAVHAAASASHASDFGRIEHEPSDVMTSAPDFGMLDVGEPTKPVARTKTPFRPRLPSQPVPQPYASEDEQTSPRLPAFGTDPAPPPSEPPSFPSGAVRAPLPPVASPPPHKPALISALAAPVRKAPSVQKAPEPTPRHKAPEPTPRHKAPEPTPRHKAPEPTPQPVRPSPSSPAANRPSAPVPQPTQPSPPPLATQPSPPPTTQPSPPPRPLPQPMAPPPQGAAQRAAGNVPPQPATAPRPSPAAPAPRPVARPQPAAARAAAAAPQAAAPRNPPQPAASEPGIAPTRVRQLYESYVQARRACKESTSTITENGLAEMLRASAEKLKGKHAGKDIDFDVVIKNGKAVLKPVIKG